MKILSTISKDKLKELFEVLEKEGYEKLAQRLERALNRIERRYLTRFRNILPLEKKKCRICSVPIGKNRIYCSDFCNRKFDFAYYEGELKFSKTDEEIKKLLK